MTKPNDNQRRDDYMSGYNQAMAEAKTQPPARTQTSDLSGYKAKYGLVLLRLSEAERQRDDLLAALRNLHAEVEPLRYSFKQSLHNAMAQARAAIARGRRAGTMTLYEWECPDCESITNGCSPEHTCRFCGQGNIVRDLTAQEAETDTDYDEREVEYNRSQFGRVSQ